VKTILITGASSGIGRALAVRAARAGYGVYAVGRNVNALAALAAQIAEEGANIATDACDISQPANAPGLIGRAVGAFGRIDVLVNNAGAAAVGPVATQTDDELRAQFGTHVIGPLALVREALPALRASHGHVFMIGSGVARVPIGGMGAYPASKAALRSATATLRRELQPFDIAVTYVDPGAVDTHFMTRAGMPGAPPEVLVSPELVARKILLAVGTRPRVLNVAPLQSAAVALAELMPYVTDLILERNPSLTGTGATTAIPAITMRDVPGETLALAQTLALQAAQPEPVPEPEPEPEPVAASAPESEPEVADERPHADTRAQERVEEPVGAAASVEEEEEFPIGALPGDASHEDETDVGVTTQFNAALEPLLRRMERAHLDPAFVRGLLVPEAVIDVSEVAMRWAGMPNKHERALTSEVFFALAEWGFLAPRADGRYRVVRATD
jgi:short-subunit dehydrogenase